MAARILVIASIVRREGEILCKRKGLTGGELGAEEVDGQSGNFWVGWAGIDAGTEICQASIENFACYQSRP